jgi:hypothetical protein
LHKCDAGFSKTRLFGNYSGKGGFFIGGSATEGVKLEPAKIAAASAPLRIMPTGEKTACKLDGKLS